MKMKTLFSGIFAGLLALLPYTLVAQTNAEDTSTPESAVSTATEVARFIEDAVTARPKVNGIWVGYYEQRNKRTPMSMVLYYNPQKNNYYGTISDYYPGASDEGFINAELDDIQVQGAIITFNKEYTFSPSLTRFFSSAYYTLNVANPYTMTGHWNIDSETGKVFFRKIIQ